MFEFESGTHRSTFDFFIVAAGVQMQQNYIKESNKTIIMT